MRNRVASAFKNPAIRLVAVALLAGVASGCSSDVTRFDYGLSSSDNLTTSSISPNRINAVNGQVPTPSANVASARQIPQDLANPLSQPIPAAPGAYGTTLPVASNARTMSGSSIQSSNLSAPVSPQMASARTPKRMNGGAMTPDPLATGTIRPGSAKYDVIPQEPPRNQLASVGTRMGNVPEPRPVPAHAPHQQAAIVPAAPQPDRKKNQFANADGSASKGEGYKVAAGDSLGAIARKNGISVNALKAANKLTDNNIRIGQVLTIPSTGSSKVEVASAKIETPDNIKTSTVPTKSAASGGPKPYTPPAVSAKESVSSAAKNQVASAAPAETGISKYRWPVTGAVIAGYGANVEGHRNDGIDISVPEGTPVKAAENGIVIYAGNGLEKLGNTVLIRHKDGTVTVYAHAEKLDVNRGDTVTRGQVIALSGMTGDASRPKLHFEVRKNSAPVNPMTFLE